MEIFNRVFVCNFSCTTVLLIRTKSKSFYVMPTCVLYVRATPTVWQIALGKSLFLPNLNPKCQVEKRDLSNGELFGVGKLKFGGPHVWIIWAVVAPFHFVAVARSIVHGRHAVSLLHGTIGLPIFSTRATIMFISEEISMSAAVVDLLATRCRCLAVNKTKSSSWWTRCCQHLMPALSNFR